MFPNLRLYIFFTHSISAPKLVAIVGAEHNMAAMAAPPGGYYDTGVIDSKAVQDQFPTLFRTIMERLKQQLFANWEHPWYYYNSKMVDWKVIKKCLRAMSKIRLVIIEHNSNRTKKRARLVQACDDTLSSTHLDAWGKGIFKYGKNLSFQRRQKKSLLDDPETRKLYRGLDISEVTNFKLGGGQFLDKNRQQGRFQTSSSFWTHRYETAKGYMNDETTGENGPTGTVDGVIATTKTEDIIKIADINSGRMFQKYIEQHPKEFFWEILEIFIDKTKKPRLFQDFAMYYYNLWARQDILEDLKGKNAYKHLKEIVDEIRSGIEEQIDEYVNETGNDFMDKMWRKPTARQLENRPPEDKRFVSELTSLEATQMLYIKLTAAFLLNRVNEVNFIYHPWVTVEEIQATRIHLDNSELDESKTMEKDFGLKEEEEESAAGGDRKRRRLEFVDLFPDLRL